MPDHLNPVFNPARKRHPYIEPEDVVAKLTELSPSARSRILAAWARALAIWEESDARWAEPLDKKELARLCGEPIYDAIAAEYLELEGEPARYELDLDGDIFVAAQDLLPERDDESYDILWMRLIPGRALYWLAKAYDRRALRAEADDIAEPIAHERRSPAMFYKRAAWLRTQMAARKRMTVYQLHKAGGPDKKTINRILAGYPVREEVLARLAAGLSHDNPPVAVEDIPSN